MKKGIFKEVESYTPTSFQDHRGELYTTWNNEEFKDYFGKDLDFVRDKVSVSRNNVLRGIHGDEKSWKLMSCTYGEVYYVVVDCRESSPTYKKWDWEILSDKNRKMLLIPPGFGCAFYVLSDLSIVNYKWAYPGSYPDVDDQFSMRWNDSRLNIFWPCEKPILSERDATEKNILRSLVMKQVKANKEGLTKQLRDGHEDYFDLRDVEYEFGTRKVYFKKDQEKYEILQAARGGSTFLREDKDYDEMIEETNRLTRDVTDQDALRIRELHGILEVTDHLRLLETGAKFAELGFRVPKLLKYYKDTHRMQVRGFDVLDINIATGKELGYEVFKYDFNDCSKHLDLESEDVVVSYHMIEHLSDPLKALEKIFYSMKDLGVLHIEVPLEPGVPNIRYGHLFPFEKGDLEWMLNKVGFNIIGTSHDAFNPGFHIERHFVQKVLRPKTDDKIHPLLISHHPEEALPKNNKKD